MLNPVLARTLNPELWDLLIRQGRSALLLGKLACILQHHDLLASVPYQPLQHLTSALKVVTRQDKELSMEVRLLFDELKAVGARVALLKGAAYAVSRLKAAEGRIFSDIDIIVAKRHIGQVESELMLHGWQGGGLDEWDQRYYRQWMHEVPPMRHVTRGITVDLHHAILPETARIKVNTYALLAAMRPVDREPGIHVLAPSDMLLHSATHLFHEGELDKGLRDLFDIDSLLRELSAQEPGFWNGLVPRANELGLLRPLFYALRYCEALLKTPIPASVTAAARTGAPPRTTLALMDWCYTRALRPTHPDSRLPGNGLARFALYVRSHWIRMPFGLLVMHLGRKAWIRLTAKPAHLDEEDQNDPAQWAKDADKPQ